MSVSAPGHFLDAAHKCSRHRGGHLALRVFWVQGGSQETDAWEVPGTLEVGPGLLSALSLTRPSPSAPYCGLSFETQSKSTGPGVGTRASPWFPHGPGSPHVNLHPLWVLCALCVKDYQPNPMKTGDSPSLRVLIQLELYAKGSTVLFCTFLCGSSVCSERR